MPSFEQDYTRRAPATPRMPPVTKWLLILNVGIFFGDLLFLGGGLGDWGAFAFASAIGEGRIYEFVTFQFLHGSVGHLLFNCIGIYFLAPFVERWWGSRKFLWYYLLCGIAGGLFFTLLYSIGLIPNARGTTNLVGASAGLFGVIFAIYVIAPAVRVRLLIPPIELTMKQFSLALGGLAAATILGGLVFPESRIFWNSGGEAGHLGGAIMGLILMKNPWLLGLGRRPGAGGVRAKPHRTGKPKLRPRSRIDPQAANEVDRILDKVSEEGFGSLTPEEREILHNASNHER